MSLLRERLCWKQFCGTGLSIAFKKKKASKLNDKIPLQQLDENDDKKSVNNSVASRLNGSVGNN